MILTIANVFNQLNFKLGESQGMQLCENIIKKCNDEIKSLEDKK